jgi:hypothetical protein
MAGNGQGRGGRKTGALDRRAVAGRVARRVSEAPVLEGDRVRLREHRAEDLDDYATLWSDEAGRPPYRWQAARTPASAGAASCGFAACGRCSASVSGSWRIETQAELIGEAGIMDLRRDIKPSLDGTLEAGWALLPAVSWAGHGGRGHEDWFSTGPSPSPFARTPLSCIIAEGNRHRSACRKARFRPERSPETIRAVMLDSLPPRRRWRTRSGLLRQHDEIAAAVLENGEADAGLVLGASATSGTARPGPSASHIPPRCRRSRARSRPRHCRTALSGRLCANS